MQSLVILQKQSGNKTIRTIHKACYLEHNDLFFKQSNLLKLINTVSYQTAIIMYKANKVQLPENRRKLIVNLNHMNNLENCMRIYC